MKPIAQTFIANEPSTDIEALFLTRVDLYFRSKSSTLGVEVQIRETVNGVPTQHMLPFASKILTSAEVSTSSDGSVPTTFTFNTPVVLRTNTQFAIVVIPIGGNPDYTIWTAALGDTDLATSTPIFTNNQLGSLFISSNDLNFTAVQNESMKYKLWTAEFTETTGYAVYRNSNTDFFKVKDIIGDFIPGEQIVVANNTLSLAALAVSGANTFSNGTEVSQSNSTANYANGIVYYCNTTLVLLSNVEGRFTTANTLVGNSGVTIAAPSAVYQNVITASGNTVTIPNANSTLTTDFTVGNYIYIGTNSRANVEIVKIESLDATNRTMVVSPNISFTDTNAIIGRVKADAALYGVFSSRTKAGAAGFISIDNVTSNASVNFAGSENNILIGRSSGASANNLCLIDLAYDSITSQFSYINPKLTTQNWNFQGISNTKTIDSSYTLLESDIPYEFVDKQRLIMSRSNEFADPISSAGDPSLTIKTTLTTANTKISPYIDEIRKVTTLTHNLCYPETYLSGYLLSLANTSGENVTGQTIWQSNSSTNSYGTVLYCNSTFMVVGNVVSSNSLTIPGFIANSTSIITNSNNAVTANVTASIYYNEETGSGYNSITRYISKNIILETGQDAEDLVSYVGAYRPTGTNLFVYAKCLAASDGDSIEDKGWSFMPETSSPALISSLVNRNDLVELSYSLPESVQVYSSLASGNTTTDVFTVPATGSTSAFRAGNFIYITDATPANANGFNVRQIVSVPNNTSLVLSANLSFTSSNCAVGNIPGLRHKTGAFRYSNNYNIARYSTETDSIYDTIKTFAIKIVLVSNSSQIVPRMSDMRTIAMQA